ncbi:alpha/beta fold hydrolase [Nonomuraea sp. SMC257]|uniref:Alpha/beta fold hydrolase n=1 Tax=Nonomuraea montanisoli TaxID=2741721 RepID=A0A7Y6I7H9_9ACTN|nr:alpha/beta hydrolase [Nonomuraea montanisoli]NUW31839.1 alpha/beta fold hydrolase [Nonomuraea montanisoli]
MSLSHDVAGDGPAVVLLHSGVCDRRMWDPQWTALAAAGYRVIRPDLRGFGLSPVADGPYSDAGDVAGLLRALGVERATLVASSYGGRVALELAASRPELVTALALLCPGVPGHVPGPELRSFAEREDALLAAGDLDGAVELNVETWLGPEGGDEARERVRTMQRRAFEVQLAAAEQFPQTRPEADLAGIAAPCLVVSGAHDVPDFREIAARLPERLRQARHVELAWAGHLPSLERPDEVTELLLDYLRVTAPPARANVSH